MIHKWNGYVNNIRKVNIFIQMPVVIKLLVYRWKKMRITWVNPVYMKLQIFTGLDASWSSNIHNILFTGPDVISLVLLTSYKENYRTFAPEI